MRLDLALSSRSTTVRSTRANVILIVVVDDLLVLLPRRVRSTVARVVRVVNDRVLVVVQRVDVDVVTVSLNVRRSRSRFGLGTENVDVSEIEESSLLSESCDIVSVSSDVRGRLVVLRVVTEEVQIEVVQVVEESSGAEVTKGAFLSDREDIVAVSDDVGRGRVRFGLVTEDVQVEVVEEATTIEETPEERVRVRVVSGNVREDRDREDVVDRVGGTDRVET